MAKKHIGFLIVYGPEVRAFVHSGLIKKLSEKYDVSIITTHPDSAAFDNVNYAKIYKMPAVNEHPLLVRIRAWTRRSHQAWLQKKNFSTWNHFLPSNTSPKIPLYKRIWRTIFQQAYSYYVWKQVEQIAATRYGENIVWKQLLQELNLSCLVAAPLKGETILPALQTAKIMGCKVVTASNSWKDIFVSSHISVLPDKIIMPNKTPTEFLLATNPHILPERVSTSTSLYFEKILHPDSILPRAEFCALMRLDPGRPYICYTAATPLAVSGELEIIQNIVGMLEKHPARPQLLLRENPMDNYNQFSDLQEQHPDILFVQKPIWEWNPREDWMCALEPDVPLWINTIYHSACNISIPSTVSIEFAAFKKPVINICFDLSVTAGGSSISRFWNAPFYDEVRKTRYTIPTFSLNNLQNAIEAVLDNRCRPPKAEFFPTEFPVAHVVGQIEACLEQSALV